MFLTNGNDAYTFVWYIKQKGVQINIGSIYRNYVIAIGRFLIQSMRHSPNKPYFHIFQLLTLLFLLSVQGANASAKPSFHLEGYGEMLYSYFDFGPDQKSGPNGSPPDSRATIDITRLALELEVELIKDTELEAEVEFEHGGAGAALELEFEEFGEFEQEIEKGGEVVVEELAVERTFSDAFRVRLGHFYVAVGHLSHRYHPADFFGSRRAEAETSIIPALWHETGVEVSGAYRNFRYQLQLVNGLDATGFSSQNWIVGGHQKRFETIQATNMAWVARLDYQFAPHCVLGISGYRGDSADNRPKPDMEGIDAHVSIVDVHGSLDWGRVRARGLYLYGHLQNAALVSARNRTLSNNLDVLRSPVAQAAYAAFVEVGYDVLPWLAAPSPNRLDLFIRLDAYDSMAAVPDETFDNPRFARRVYIVGANYNMEDTVVLKADYAMRRLGAARFNPENTLSLGLGFQF